MTTAPARRSAAACAVALACAVSLAVSAETPTAPGNAAAPSNAAPRTLANLQQTFAAEKNAEARYLAFARQADREGFKGAASLFRAVAKSESIQAANHVHALAWLYAEARVQLEQAYAETTLANLAGAIVDEATLQQERYPDCYRQARAEHQTVAMRSFNYAESAEGDHARLMIDVLGALPTATVPTAYWVCRACGRTVAHAPAGRCPVCFTPAKKFVRVI